MNRIFFITSSLLASLSMCAQHTLDSSKKWSYHYQLTAISQSHPSFTAKYSGNNSLTSEAETNKLSLTTTLFLGRRLWKNAALYFNPEIAGGQGISSARGIAGYTNGETFRIGSTEPVLYIARMFFQQHIPLGHAPYNKIEPTVNQVQDTIPASRLTITAGKICLSDFFDNNSYSHDPRSQFMNWSLMSNAAWDYPADTRGYTQGIVAELTKPLWAVRFGIVLEPRKANGLQLDYHIAKAHSETIELERSWKAKHSTTVRLLAFHNASQAPSYRTTLLQVNSGDSSSVDVYTGGKEWKQYGGVKYGFGINAERDISNTIGAFFKASWNDGATATWAFTEIDRSLSAGVSIKGNRWKRTNDNIGVAQVINGISKDHRDFLNNSLYGFIIGDGKLSYGAEAITEIYYKAKLASSLFLSADYQFVVNPAYNKDRGPVHVFSIRGHIEF